MNARSKIFWIIWLLVVIGVIWWLATLCASGVPPLPGKKKQERKTAFVSQGDGALALIARTVVMPPKKFVYPPHYFVATATDDVGRQSDYSNEIAFTNYLPGLNRTLTLAWDAGPSTNRVVNYRIYHGRASGIYTNTYNAGTNLMLSVPLTSPPLTNIVIAVTSQNATNLQWCSRLGEPWNLLGATNWTETNPTPRMWRAIGRRTTPGKVFISARWQ